MAAIRFNMNNQEHFGGLAGGVHHNVPMSSNAVLHQENWMDENGNPSPAGEANSSHHYKVGGSKMKLGAATSTNFMKGGHGVTSQQNQYNMSMLRSVQQNMPNMPNVSKKCQNDFYFETN